MQLSRIVETMEKIAPTGLAESWDNVGLLVGDQDQAINRAILTIDYTDAVAREAKLGKCDLVIAYHPPLFHAVKRLTAGSLIFDAIRRGVAIYSPHTALDVADGGTNDMLADAIGMEDRQPLRMIQPKATQYKLVTFVPEKDVETVSRALFEAGAGRIGQYSSCSFRSAGTGTFFGEDGTNPTVGQSGKLERADEIRVETVVSISKVEAVIRALRNTHPYEEPAFDLNQLAAPPEGVGQGRIGKVTAGSRAEVIDRIKRELQLDRVLVAGPTDQPISRAAVCAGACHEFLADAIAQSADLFVTGELRHHDALEAARNGVTVVCTPHSNSERAVLPRLKARLFKELPDLPVMISEMDADPFTIA
jgi:dinuclear metal center YbgI/SA1388 family protein